VRVVSKESVFVLKFDQAAPAMVSDASQKFFGKLTVKLADRTNLFLVSQVPIFSSLRPPFIYLFF
jgi:hypothetical protein